MNFFPTVCEGWEKNIYNQISEFGIKSGNSKSSYFVRPAAGPLNYYTDNMTTETEIQWPFGRKVLLKDGNRRILLQNVYGITFGKDSVVCCGFYNFQLKLYG